jgi:hypothetical protein
MMIPNEQKNILVCGSNTSLQMIAQTIEILFKEGGQRIDEIHIMKNSFAGSRKERCHGRKKLLDLCTRHGIVLNFIGLHDAAPAGASGKVKIDPAKTKIIVDAVRIKLTPGQLFFYTMFALFRQQLVNSDGVMSLEDLTSRDFDRILRKLTKACGRELGIHECYRSKQFKFLEVMVSQITSVSRKREADIADFKANVRIIFSRINGKIRKAGLPESYTIRLCRNRGKACYIIGLAPENIYFTGDDDDPDTSNIAKPSYQSLAA